VGDPTRHERGPDRDRRALGTSKCISEACRDRANRDFTLPDKDKMISDLGADEIVRDGKSLTQRWRDVILSTSLPPPNFDKSRVDSIQGLGQTAGSSQWADAEPLSIC